MVTSLKFTYEDYRNAPDDKRYELLDGELVVSPSPKTQHQRLVWKFGRPLADFVETRGLGEVFFSPFDVMFSNADVVQPDLIFVSNERAHIVTPDDIKGAPDLVVEILSPSTAGRDRTFKRALYERHFVREYWLVDPTAKNVTVLLLAERGFDLVGIYGEGQTLTSPTLSGFTLDLDSIF